jgi:RNA polymerase sigma-70 factor (ECF subfamily)
MVTEAEQLLIQAIRAGGAAGESAYRQLVEDYEGRLRAYARRRLADPATVDDVVQEVFIGFLRSIGNYDEAKALQTWLFSIAAYKVTDQLRRAGRRQAHTGTDLDDEQLDREADARQRAASSIACSQEQIELESNAIRDGLRDVLGDLFKQRKYTRVLALELLFVKGMPNWEVAQKLKLSEQDVANYRFAAVRKLAAAMKQAGLPTDVFPELDEPGE